jgi:hypothetical protein
MKHHPDDCGCKVCSPVSAADDVRDAVWTELLECYGEGDDTDWPYLTDLTDLIVSMIQRHGRPEHSDGSISEEGS